MAQVARSSDCEAEGTSLNHATQVSAAYNVAGEDLDACAPCYKGDADNEVYMCDGTAADEKAVVLGWTVQAVLEGEPVTLWGPGTIMMYDSAGGLTPGARLFLDTTAGRLNDAATTGDAEGHAVAVDSKHVVASRLG